MIQFLLSWPVPEIMSSYSIRGKSDSELLTEDRTTISSNLRCSQDLAILTGISIKKGSYSVISFPKLGNI